MKICSACKTRFDSDDWRCTSCGFTPPEINGYPALAEKLASSNEGFHPEYFGQLAALETGNFWFQSRNNLILLLINKHLPNPHSFLEIGCGTGFVLSGIASTYPSAKLTGAEIFSAGLSYAALRLPAAKFMQMDARDIPFDAHFDGIGAFDVLEHIEEDETVLKQMYQALKLGGVVILTVPQHPALWSAQDEMACHVRRYTATELSDKAARAGFDVVDSGSFVSLLLPLMWLSRKLGNTRNDGQHDPMVELRIGNVMNFILRTIMSAEIFLTRLGVRFPAGGSLFIVGRKRA